MSNPGRCQNEHYYVGAVIDGHYHLTKFLGAGGMACVYEAQEVGSPHRYAIKFLKEEFHNHPYLIEFFRDEASSMRDLAHPNIVRFYRFSNTEHYSYIIMEFVDGFALSEVIERVYAQKRKIPLDEAVRIITQVARALDAIHREGYVHRDVKPSNVLIERGTGQTFLTDLGITSASNTRIEGAGTLAYMPPEMHETWVADFHADVYSFGIVIYELLAKERPFDVASGLSGAEAEMDLLRKHKEYPVPEISKRRKDLPKELDAIIERALAKKPEDRYDNVLDVARDVHAVLKPQLAEDMQDFATITHRKVAAPEVFAPTGSNQRLFIAMLFMGIAAIVLAGAIAASSIFEPAIPTNTPTHTPTASMTPSNTPTATQTPSPTHTPTVTPHPLVNQDAYPLLSGHDALVEPQDIDRLLFEPVEDGALNHLKVGMVDGFRFELSVLDAAVAEYGLAFRVQDLSNYLLFTLRPETGEWAFSTVVNGRRSEKETGTFTSIPDSLTIEGRQDFFRVLTDVETLIWNQSEFPQGSLALYVEAGLLELESLSIELVGEEAELARSTTPTPAPGLVDPLRFIQADVASLLATNNVARSEIDCPVYIGIYEELDRHLTSTNDAVRSFALQTISAGEIIYLRCQSESPNAPFSFLSDFQDYRQWENALRSIQQDVTDSE